MSPPGNGTAFVFARFRGLPSDRSTTSTTSAATDRYVVSLPPDTEIMPDGLRSTRCSRDALAGAPVNPDATSGRIPAQAATTSAGVRRAAGKKKLAAASR